MKTKFHHNIEEVKLKRKKLRNEPTLAEKKLWQRINKSQLGAKFRRQHSIDFYILDFYCPEYKLGIEIDGSSHVDRRQYDEYRTGYISAFNIKIIRFWNFQVEKNIEWVITKIRQSIPS